MALDLIDYNYNYYDSMALWLYDCDYDSGCGYNWS